MLHTDFNKTDVFVRYSEVNDNVQMLNRYFIEKAIEDGESFAWKIDEKKLAECTHINLTKTTGTRGEIHVMYRARITGYKKVTREDVFEHYEKRGLDPFTCRGVGNPDAFEHNKGRTIVYFDTDSVEVIDEVVQCNALTSNVSYADTKYIDNQVEDTKSFTKALNNIKESAENARKFLVRIKKNVPGNISPKAAAKAISEFTNVITMYPIESKDNLDNIGKDILIKYVQKV